MNRKERRASAGKKAREPSASQLLQTGLQHQRAGRRGEAVTAFKTVLGKRPNDPKALHSLGLARYQAGRYVEAAALMGRAIAVNGRDPGMHTHRALALQKLGKLKEAEDAARRAVDLKPDDAAAHNNLGFILQARRKRKDAVASYRNALALEPDNLRALTNLGHVLGKERRFEEAEEVHRRATELDPERVKTRIDLGVVLWRLGRNEEAEAILQRALELEPNNSEVNRNLANVRFDQLRLTEAEAGYRRATELKPDAAGAHYSLSTLHLLKGEYGKGWALHEWRWRTRQMRPKVRKFSKPQWDGEDLNGGTILLHAEQGLGDAIQFVRYASFAASKAGRVILECKPALVDILETVAGVDEVVARGSDLPPFDVHCPLLSLPHLHGTVIETIPAPRQYLTPDPVKVRAWAKRLAGPKLKVGLVWAGNPQQPNDLDRSLEARHLCEIAGVANLSLFSLQVGVRSADLKTLPDQSAITDLAPLLTDYSETAAAVANLDLVISVCTSVAHLTGALGTPIWVMLPFKPSWRWLLEREDSPWYQSARLYRQETPGDWRPVLDRIRADLRTLSAA